MKLRFNPQPKPKAEQKKTRPAEGPPRRPSKIKPRPKFKPQPGYIRLAFTLAYADFHILRRCAKEKGIEEHDLSTALRLILREWKTWHDRQGHPLLIALPPDMLPANDPSDDGS